MRYGAYLAALSVVSVSAEQKALASVDVKVDGDKNPDVLRTATVNHLRDNDAEFEALSFSVAHCLEVHRPLGPIMRARLRACPAMVLLRRQGNQ